MKFDNSKRKFHDYDSILGSLKMKRECDSSKVDRIQVDSSIDSINHGVGFDAVHSNHLKLLGPVAKDYLASLFSSFVRHSYIPGAMLQGEIIPIIKDKNASQTASSNYRPIMISSNILKIFEHCILFQLRRFLIINPRQFGFRANTRCSDAITVLKETIYTYTSQGSNVHCAKVDLSKAFDKINHSYLISKLSKTNVPPLIILVLGYMLENVDVCVAFGAGRGELWRVENGVRQGGILSPYLFNFYINEIIDTVSRSNTGCYLGYYATNILCYADDIFLCSPSSNGLQKLLGIICDQLNQHCLPLNDKSEYIIFFHKITKLFPVYSLILNGEVLNNVKNCKYLGTILSYDFKIQLDVDRCCDTFLRQFNSINFRFSFKKKRNFTVFIQIFLYVFLWGRTMAQL